jgi:hypothetical protein
MFMTNNEVLLNHRPDHAEHHPLHQPKGIEVIPNLNARGEDDPLYSMRLERDGWRIIQEGEFRIDYRTNGGFVTIQPTVRELRHPKTVYTILKSTIVMGFWVHEKFEVLNSITGVKVNLPKAEFACWDQRGRLAILGEGKLRICDFEHANEISFKVIADFAAEKPEEIQSPSWAREW